MIKKRLEKSPLNCPLVTYINFVDPRILTVKKEASAEKLTRILRIMIDVGRTTDSECDEVLKQFNDIHEHSLTTDSQAFKSF